MTGGSGGGWKSWVHAHAPRGLVNLTWNLASDVKDLPSRMRAGGRPSPWRVWHNVGGGDFHATGRYFFDHFRRAVELKPDDHVLDIGCGAGRLAFPIVAFLDGKGAYIGFDLSERALAFARKHVRGDASVRFVRADVASAEYAGRGVSAARYRFPAEDGTIDAALAISVFSHLLPEDARAYLVELGRVLKPGGRALLTGFLVDAPAQARLEAGGARLALRPFRDDAWAVDPRHPERAIGFDRRAFDAWVAAAGLGHAAPVVPGDWSRREPGPEYQDRIVLEKPA